MGLNIVLDPLFNHLKDNTKYKEWQGGVANAEIADSLWEQHFLCALKAWMARRFCWLEENSSEVDEHCGFFFFLQCVCLYLLFLSFTSLTHSCKHSYISRLMLCDYFRRLRSQGLCSLPAEMCCSKLGFPFPAAETAVHLSEGRKSDWPLWARASLCTVSLSLHFQRPVLMLPSELTLGLV